MKIDAHHHLWDLTARDYDWMAGAEMAPIRRNFAISDLQAAIAGTGIERTVYVQASMTHEETYEILELAQSVLTIVAVVGWLDVDSPLSLAECEKYLAAPGGAYLKGIRDIAQDHPDPGYLARPQVIKNVQGFGKLDITYDILTKTPELKAAIDLVRACPDTRFVLDHISKPYISRHEFEPWKSLITELASFENVSCKISGLVTEAKWKEWQVSDFAPYTDHIIESFSTKRIMFGSDWPVALLGADSYSDVVQLADKLTENLSDSEKEAFWKLNVMRSYKITNV
jgi:L-fuconolactonase